MFFCVMNAVRHDYCWLIRWDRFFPLCVEADEGNGLFARITEDLIWRWLSLMMSDGFPGECDLQAFPSRKAGWACAPVRCFKNTLYFRKCQKSPWFIHVRVTDCGQSGTLFRESNVSPHRRRSGKLRVLVWTVFLEYVRGTKVPDENAWLVLHESNNETEKFSPFR